MNKIGMEELNDHEEEEIRNTIDFLENEAVRIEEANSQLLEECSKDMGALHTLRKQDRSLKHQYAQLQSSILTTRLQRQRESERQKYMAKKQKSYEKNKKLVVELHNSRFFPKSTQENEVHLIGKMNSLMSKERRTILKSIQEDMRFARKQQYLEVKQDKAELAKTLFVHEQKSMEENRKRHLQVLYQEKMSRIAKETLHHLKIKNTLKRIEEEKEVRLKLKEEYAKKIDRLERINQLEKSSLEEHKTQTQAILKDGNLMSQGFTRQSEYNRSTKSKLQSRLSSDIGDSGKPATHTKANRASSLDPFLFENTDTEGETFNDNNMLLMTSVELEKSGMPVKIDLKHSDIHLDAISSGKSHRESPLPQEQSGERLTAPMIPLSQEHAGMFQPTPQVPRSEQKKTTEFSSPEELEYSSSLENTHRYSALQHNKYTHSPLKDMNFRLSTFDAVDEKSNLLAPTESSKSQRTTSILPLIHKGSSPASNKDRNIIKLIPIEDKTHNPHRTKITHRDNSSHRGAEIKTERQDRLDLSVQEKPYTNRPAKHQSKK